MNYGSAAIKAEGKWGKTSETTPPLTLREVILRRFQAPSVVGLLETDSGISEVAGALRVSLLTQGPGGESLGGGGHEGRQAGPGRAGMCTRTALDRVARPVLCF